MCSSDLRSELFLQKKWTESFLQIDTSGVPISLFGVDIPASSEGIRLSSKASGRTNDRIKVRKELQQVDLLLSQEFDGCKVL